MAIGIGPAIKRNWDTSIQELDSQIFVQNALTTVFISQCGGLESPSQRYKRIEKGRRK
jgi:hypothetical protein